LGHGLESSVSIKWPAADTGEGWCRGHTVRTRFSAVLPMTVQVRGGRREGQ
jgi:hypothetical protein